MRKLTVMLLVFALVLCSMYVPEHSTAAGVGGTDIVGTVVDESGLPFEGVEISAVNVTKPTTVFKAYSDVNGNYSMPSNFVPGLYNVTAVFTNYSANMTYTNVLLELGAVVRFNFTLTEVLCTLTGYVTNGTVPVFGATVTLMGEDRTYEATSINPFGQYTVANVTPGWYTVEASKIGYFTSDPQPPLNMERGVVKSVDFTLREQEARLLSGQVTHDGDGLAGVRVVLTASGSTYASETVTDSNGNYSFIEIPVGGYTLTFTKDKFLEGRLSAALSLNETKRIDIEMEYDSANNTQTFILGLDLAHSLMVIGLGVSILVMIVGLFLNYKVRRKPEILERADDELEKR